MFADFGTLLRVIAGAGQPSRMGDPALGIYPDGVLSLIVGIIKILWESSPQCGSSPAMWEHSHNAGVLRGGTPTLWETSGGVFSVPGILLERSGPHSCLHFAFDSYAAKASFAIGNGCSGDMARQSWLGQLLGGRIYQQGFEKRGWRGTQLSLSCTGISGFRFVCWARLQTTTH